MSSTEAEYMSLSDSSKEAIHLRRLLTEIIYNDNQGAGHNFTRECIYQGDVELKYIAITDMSADVLTKGLSAPKHNSCLSKLGLTNIK